MKLLIKNGAKPDYKTALKKAKRIRLNILLKLLRNIKDPSPLTEEEINTVRIKHESSLKEVIKYLREIQKGWIRGGNNGDGRIKFQESD